MKQWNHAVWIGSDTWYALLHTIWSVVSSQSLVKFRYVISAMFSCSPLEGNMYLPLHKATRFLQDKSSHQCTNTKFQSPEPLAKVLTSHAQINISPTVHSYSPAHKQESHRLTLKTRTHRFICGNYSSCPHEITWEPINLWHTLLLQGSLLRRVKWVCTEDRCRKREG